MNIDWEWYELGGLVSSVIAGVLYSIMFILILLDGLGVLK